jgi:hypothetical protein
LCTRTLLMTNCKGGKMFHIDLLQQIKEMTNGRIIITGDENWVRQYDCETEWQSMEWKSQAYPAPVLFLRLQRYSARIVFHLARLSTRSLSPCFRTF